MNRAWGDELAAAQLYGVLRLRAAVFVVEQECAYQELDGRDLARDTLHLWEGPDTAPVAYLRLLREDAGRVRIGRVCVARAARRTGHAGRLLRAALAEAGTRACVLDAQSHLAPWYRTFGFHDAGPEFLQDGIPHVPMARD